jgi:DNA replication protein DnaC
MTEGSYTEKTVHCEKHGDYEAAVGFIFGPEMVSYCPSCQQEQKERERQRKVEANEEHGRQQITRNRVSARIPTRFAKCTFDQYIARSEDQKTALTVAWSFATNFDSVLARGSSLTMCGSPGTGKTHLAAAIANHVLGTGRTVVYKQAIEAIQGIRDTWRKDAVETESSVLESFVKADLLVLDEIGVQFRSEAEKIHLFDILDGRYREQKPTVLISNLGAKEFSDCLGERVFDRLMELGSAVVIFNWKSYRCEQSGVVPKTRLSEPAQPTHSAGRSCGGKTVQ